MSMFAVIRLVHGWGIIHKETGELLATSGDAVRVQTVVNNANARLEAA